MCHECDLQEMKPDEGRRKILHFAAAGAAGLLLPEAVLAHSRASHLREEMERVLKIFNPQTGEYFKAAYWVDGKYIPDAIKRLNHVLRDHHNDEVARMDKRLVDALYKLSQRLGTSKPIQVTSAYRSLETNRLLARRGYQVAQDSFHLKGKAVDIIVPGRSVAEVNKAALSLRTGGVGYYPSRGHVHLDVGPLRKWVG